MALEVEHGPTMQGKIETAKLRSASFDLIKVAAQMLGVSVHTIRRWQAAGQVPARVRHGHRMKYHQQDIAPMRDKSSAEGRLK